MEKVLKAKSSIGIKAFIYKWTTYLGQPDWKTKQTTTKTSQNKKNLGKILNYP